MASWNPIRRSAMHHKQVALGASMEERNGWQQPVRYSSDEEELRCLKSGAGIHDISSVGKISIQGDDIENYLSTNFSDGGGLAVGEVRHVASASIAAADKFVLARMAQDNFLVLTPADQTSALAESLTEDPDRCAHIVDMSSGLAGVSITGPQSSLILSQISELDLSPVGFPDMHFAQTKAAEIHGTLLRIDRGSLPSYELYFPREFGEYMWDALMEAGAEYQALPVGFEAMAQL